MSRLTGGPVGRSAIAQEADMGLDASVKKEILDAFKAQGLDVAEDAAVAAVEAVFNVLILVTPKVSAGLGALMPSFVNAVKPRIMDVLDKIDGIDDPNLGTH